MRANETSTTSVLCSDRLSNARWKQKWGILWRPLLVDVENIKSVVECTCRLHNYCIDCNCAETEFIPPFEDLWWQRTASPRRMAAGNAPLPPRAEMQPIWADGRSAQQHFGPGTGPSTVTHTRREHAVRLVELSGLVAPDASGKWTRETLYRQRASTMDENGWRI